jgi:hypothetical protein
VAVVLNVTDVPAHMVVPGVTLMLMVGVTFVVMTIVILLLVTVVGLAHVELLVSVQVITSPFSGTTEYVGVLPPTTMLFFFHT